MPSLYALLGVTQPFDPSSRFTTSWLLPPYVLAFVRLLLSLYAFVTIFFIFGWNGSHSNSLASRRSFSYFTVLTYWGLAFYFLVSGLHTFSYARHGTSWLQRWPRPLQAAHGIYYSTVVTYPILVTIVFWVILYSGPWFPVEFDAWHNISQHALNSFYCLFEILIPRTSPPPPFHVVCLVLILALYLALAYLTHATQGFYPYNFLDPGNGSGKTAGYILGILAAVLVIFGLVWLMLWLRRWLTEKVLGMGGKFSRRGARRFEDMEMRLGAGK
ncbi:hypothetical protein MMC24_000413 [Lignoscripta atroalba]|nr:hypothetical protein [Lignoscripta atroalba]